MAIRLYSVDAIFCKVRAIGVESHLGVSKGIGHYKLPVEGGGGRGEGGLGRVRGFRLCHFKIYLISPPHTSL